MLVVGDWGRNIVWMLAHLFISYWLRTLIALVLRHNLLVQGLHSFFLLNILVELDELVSDPRDHFYLLQQNFVKFYRVVQHIRVLLVHGIEQLHVLLDNVNHAIHMLFMRANQQLFLL